MILSLRARLLIGLVGLAAVGLVAASAVTYKALESSLVAGVDGQLSAGLVQAQSIVIGDDHGGPTGPPGPQHSAVRFPAGTYAGLYAQDGTLIHASGLDGTATSAVTSRPVVPKSLPNSGPDVPSAAFTVDGTGGVQHYRVVAESLDLMNGDFLVLAIPLDPIHETLSQLLLLELLVGLGVLAAMAVGGFWLVKFSLRPLARIEDTAAAIAAGDLSRRVDHATRKTEVGRLGLSLNAMLEQIESAFEERRRSESRLRQFLADASHELRTPLTSIRGYAEMLRRGAERSEEDSRVARRRIEEESVRMTSLVEDMLLLARLDQGRPLERQPVELARLAADACTDARAVAPGRSVSLAGPDHLVVIGDESRLRQVVGNLVRNAIVHTPAEASIEVRLAREDGMASLAVVDHGPGLDESQAGRVFEPFYRADTGRSRDMGGAGLGLSIVGAVVGAHEGTVTVVATPGGGATFTVRLPLAGANSSAADR